ncbi:ribose 5-phosphate isomerase B [Entomobacter blattae]|uniref:Ribose-5-P isomerase B n=1 Tax=Entomobacter blattae TaxID=2762277 RepID=A0A7H1NTX0_9PROT|nr:ribose 5-phosphate isomerase B [Entomobacter blattae]QNT79230.1 Ribose-5-P isomerase B [Entomobacter blattae]
MKKDPDMTLPIAIGADDAAFTLKDEIIRWLAKKGIPYIDYSMDKNSNLESYPDVAWTVAQAIKAGKHERGILLCGTGIGMCIVANKVPGIRAAQCHDSYSAERARKSNNAQIITIGARIIGIELAKSILGTWLDSDFQEGSSTPKVNKISYYEQQAS